jgi:uncharacterized protein YecE (DUF72 family)
MSIRIGTAGWSIPRLIAARFPAEGTSLQRFAARFRCAEINSSFHRPHRPAIYQRWADSVPDDFRFAVKLPKTITHQAKLVDCETLIASFADEVAGLGSKRGPLLVQLPPSRAFEAGIAEPFFKALAALLPGQTVCEPRHASWFEPEADALLAARQIARVAADPALSPAAAAPGGWTGLAYFRLHGSPRTYWSTYEEEALSYWADAVRHRAADQTWIIFDNTAGSGAAGNALRLQEILSS